ncbi:MAG: hypothetical protein U0360_05110 [Dehalococcoidia bacterium]
MIAGLRGTLARRDDATSTLWLDVAGVIYEVLVPASPPPGSCPTRRAPSSHYLPITTSTSAAPRPDRLPLDLRSASSSKVHRCPRCRSRPRRESVGPPGVRDRARHRGRRHEGPAAAPGIGARTAQTIIAHLQDGSLEEATPRRHRRAAGERSPACATTPIEALLALQYGRREAESMVAAALEANPELDDLEALLRAVLEQRGR